MDRWRNHAEDWLSREQQGLDEAAEAAFRKAFGALRPVEPSDGFLSRAVDATWRARTRRRRSIALAGLAASVLLVASVSAIARVAYGVAGGWLLTTAAAAMTGSAATLAAIAMDGAAWWSATALAGRVMADAVATPQGVAMVMTVEILGIAAACVLQRLLRTDVTFRGPGPLCV